MHRGKSLCRRPSLGVGGVVAVAVDTPATIRGRPPPARTVPQRRTSLGHANADITPFVFLSLPGEADLPLLAAGGALPLRFSRDYKEAALKALLTTFGSRAFLVHMPTLLEIRSPEWEGRDSPWKEVYCSPLFDAMAYWMGAVLLAPDPRYRGVAAFIPALEAHFTHVMRQELKRFEDEASGAGKSPLSFRTPKNLCLVTCLCVAPLLIYTSTSLSYSLRAFLHYLKAIHIRSGIPGDLGEDISACGFSNFIASALWINCGNTIVSHDIYLSNMTQCPRIIPPELFERAPALFPIPQLQALPSACSNTALASSSVRELAFLRVTNSEYFGVVSPTQKMSAQRRDEILKIFLGDVGTNGSLPMFPLSTSLQSELTQFSVGLARDDISMLDLLVFEDLISKGAVSPSGKLNAPHFLSAEAIAHLRTVHEKPQLREAIQRRAFFKDVIVRMDLALPKFLREGVRNNDFAGLSSKLGGPIAVLFICINYSQLRLPAALISSPELKDISGDGADGINKELLRIWFSSSAFYEATQAVTTISRMAMITISSFDVSAMRNNFSMGLYCHVCANAAFVLLLVLRRFRSVSIDALEGVEREVALEVQKQTMDSVEALLQLLDRAGQSQHNVLIALIRKGMEDPGICFSREEIGLVRSGRQIRPTCKHLKVGEIEGFCWPCARDRAAQASKDMEEEERLAEEVARADSNADSNCSSVDVKSHAVGTSVLRAAFLNSAPFRRGGKRVTFNEVVYIFETFGPDEYPGRSRMAADTVEELDIEESDRLMEDRFVLSAMVRQWNDLEVGNSL